MSPLRVLGDNADVIVIVMGVSGSGKSTVGRLLADELGWPFYDADAFHPDDNVEKMSAGEPLSDADRHAWLHAIRALIHELLRTEQNAVLACSALKEAYRRKLMVTRPEVELVYLKGSFEMIRQRLERRRGHFFDSRLLKSQFDDLEEPRQALTVSIDKAPVEIAGELRDWVKGART